MKNRTILVPAILYLGIFGLFPQETIAAVSFNDGQTHNIDYIINDSVLVYSETTVNWLDDGILPYPYCLYGLDDSMINVFGGLLEHDLAAYDNCQVTIYGGSMFSLTIGDNSQAVMYGGAMSGRLFASSNSQAAIYGGSINGGLTAVNGGQITVSGGSIGNPISTGWNGNITFIGSEFAIDGASVGYGEFDTGGLPYINGMLSGTLASGELFSNNFFIHPNGKIVLAPASIPTPGTLLLCSIGAGLVGWLRRKGGI